MRAAEERTANDEAGGRLLTSHSHTMLAIDTGNSAAEPPEDLSHTTSGVSNWALAICICEVIWRTLATTRCSLAEVLNNYEHVLSEVHATDFVGTTAEGSSSGLAATPFESPLSEQSRHMNEIADDERQASRPPRFQA